MRSRSRALRARCSRCLRASQKTGSAPSAIAIACTTSSASGLGQTSQSGAKSARIGSKCDARRLVCSPARFVTASGSPCAVDHTACVMFPRSKRPVENERWRRTASAPNPAAKAETARASARVNARARESRASVARGRLRSRVGGRPRARRRRCVSSRASSEASRRSASASASASPGRTRSALSPSTSNSRAAGVSAVTSGVAQAIAWNALFGITRAAFSERPKIPSAAPAAWSSPASCSYSTQGTHSTFAGRRSRSPSSWPVPTTRKGSSGASLAASRIVSSPCSGISLPTKSACVNAPDEPGRKTRSSAPTKQTSTRSRSASSAKKRACCSVSATTTSAAWSARRSTSESARAGSDPERKRERSETSVSASETSGLKSTGAPRAARLAAGRSKWPG